MIWISNSDLFRKLSENFGDLWMVCDLYSLYQTCVVLLWNILELSPLVGVVGLCSNNLSGVDVDFVITVLMELISSIFNFLLLELFDSILNIFQLTCYNIHHFWINIFLLICFLTLPHFMLSQLNSHIFYFFINIVRYRIYIKLEKTKLSTVFLRLIVE